MNLIPFPLAIGVLFAGLMFNTLPAAVAQAKRSPPAWYRTLEGTVVKIADGDTITVFDSDKVQHRVRIAGIDAPEKGQPFGNAPNIVLCALETGMRKSEILGHSDIKMMRRYAHLDQAHKRKALALLPGWTVKDTWHNSGTNGIEEEKGATG